MMCALIIMLKSDCLSRHWHGVAIAGVRWPTVCSRVLIRLDVAVALRIPRLSSHHLLLSL